MTQPWFWLLACGGGPAPVTPPPPGVLLITVDTWRADHFDSTTTPNAWALGERGLVFSDAWSPIGLTTPAHASMLTGLTPPHHGMRGNNHHGYVLTPASSTIAEVARDAGWHTGAFVSAWPAGPEGGLAQGWDTFSGVEAGERPGTLAVAEAQDWIAARDGPWLAWVHVYEPHGPYEPSAADLATVGGRDNDRDRYRAEVHGTDRLLGPLFSLAETTRSAVVLTADHGEVLEEEKCGWQHERSVGEGVLRVPLVVAAPDGPRGTWRGRVGLMDVFPTLLHLAGLPDPGGHDGQDLLALPTPSRTVWVGEAGLCDPGCADGCRPKGFAGKDRVVYGPTSRWLDRPGRAPTGDPTLAAHLSDWPRASEAPGADHAGQGAALGYVDP